MSEADKHEKGILKAQVERLQVELKGYRKRLSLNNGGVGSRGSPPLTAYTGQTRSNSGSSTGGNNFQFEFPKFGALPSSQMFGNQKSIANGANNGVVNRGSNTPPVITQSPASIGGVLNGAPVQPQRENSTSGRKMSPKTNTLQFNGLQNTGSPVQYANLMPSVGYSSANNMHGFASTLPQMGGDSSFGDLFSPSLLKSASMDGNNYFGTSPQDQVANNNGSQTTYNTGSGGDSTAGLNRVFQFNGGSSGSDSASPSACSSSQWNANGANSSCGTSPEPSHDSPANKDKNAVSFCDKLNEQAGCFADFSKQDNKQNVGFTGNQIDYTVPSTATFDPVLFGDYRETNDAMFGGNDFSTGFFDDALNPAPFDYGSPSNLFGILQSPQQSNATLNAQNAAVNAPAPSRNLMAEIERTREGGDDDYGLPTVQPKKTDSGGKLISCNNIWYAFLYSSFQQVLNDG